MNRIASPFGILLFACSGILLTQCNTGTQQECSEDSDCRTQAGQYCDLSVHKCMPRPCTPDCSGRECGLDLQNCGTSCGTCKLPDQHCDTTNGRCRACSPDCGVRVCGPVPNGCGESCGSCQDPKSCNISSGLCEGCVPDCSGRECGPDPQNCGTSCGTCKLLDQFCDQTNGRCQACSPNCGARVCGPVPNSCGESCGNCEDPKVCNISSGQCEDCAPNCGTRGLVAHWKLDEGTGTTVSDSSGNGHSGVNQGAAWTTGRLGSGLQFDGVSDYVELGSDLNLGPSFTITMWLKHEAGDTWRTLIGKGESGLDKDHNYVLSLTTGKHGGPDHLYFSIGDGTSFRGFTTASALDTNWHHLAALYGPAGEMKIFVDGVEQAGTFDPAGTASAPAGNSKRTLIGAASTTAMFVGGIIDDVKMYDTALSAAEILAEFQAVAGVGTVVINPDKTISINGKKTFPIFTDGPTSTFSGVKNDGVADMAQRYDFVSKSWGYYWCGNPDWRQYQKEYEAAGLFYTAQSMVCSPCPGGDTCWPIPNQTSIPFTTVDRDAPLFFGYWQMDEPTFSLDHYGSYDDLLATYRALKAFDPDHPVIVNHYTGDTTAANDYFFASQDYADIVCEDHYEIRDNVTPRENHLYYAERFSAVRTFVGGKSVDSYRKPVWVYIQANGKDAVDAAGSTLLGVTPDELRLQTFNAITIGYNGIGHWSYNSYGGSPGTNVGTWTNPALWQAAKDLFDEIKGLNDILVLPDVGRSWFQHENDTAVLITHPDLTKTISGYGTFRKLNYVLKRGASAGPLYLIVLNKDSQPLADVSVTVASLTGTSQASATTLGGKTTGSGRQGRTLLVRNGQFSDSFDSFAIHIYKITSTP